MMVYVVPLACGCSGTAATALFESFLRSSDRSRGTQCMARMAGLAERAVLVSRASTCKAAQVMCQEMLYCHTRSEIRNQFQPDDKHASTRMVACTLSREAHTIL